MHDVFEIGFREAILDDDIIVFLSIYFELNKDFIVSTEDYWSERWNGEDRIGIAILLATDGLKTNLSGFSFRELDDLELEKLAKRAAIYFNSETVIGDYRLDGESARGRFLCYFPDGSVWEAVDASHGVINDVKVSQCIKQPLRHPS